MLKVEYERLNTFFGDYTRNISKGGTFIATERPLPIGTDFVFQLHVPGRETPFVLRGVVQWVNTSAHKGHPTRSDVGMGIAFVWAHDDERLAFEVLVEQLLEDALGPAAARALSHKR